MPARPNLFDNDLDVTGFAPKAAPQPAPPLEQVREVTAALNFRSREPGTSRKPRRYRTGRTAQLNVRTTPDTVDAFYAIADQQGWKVGETLEHALVALQEKLGR